jgi:general secretion pathway protein K
VNTTRPPSPRRGQRGAALLTAMIIVALVATLAAAMVWQQWRAVQVEAAERARAQSAWILIGARDFAGLILKEDFKGGRITALTEPWALPLQESRLSTFLAVDTANTGDGPEAFLSGNIVDAQARFNLNNLVVGGKIDPVALETLKRLCATAGVDGGVAERIASGLLAASSPAPTAGAPLKPDTVAQLSWLGIDPSTLTALRPYVVLLPIVTTVNINTAPKEVIEAVLDIDGGSATRLVQIRQRAPFQNAQDLYDRGAIKPPATPVFGVRSDFFEVSGSLRLADHVLTERSLGQRGPNGVFASFQRERIAGLDPVDK